LNSRKLARALPLEIGALSAFAVWASVSFLAPPPASAITPGSLSDPSSAKTLYPQRISVIFAPTVQFWAPDIQRWADEYGLDPNLAATVMQIESCGNPQAKSQAGALGLFQVMPLHFPPGENGLDPGTNARRGLAYLADDLQRAHGQYALALAAYNGGPERLTQGPDSWPAETQRYVYWATGIYQQASSAANSSSRLVEWEDAGGAHLCSLARQVLGLPGG